MTSKQQRFAEEYVLDHNASAAALRAGFAPKSARVTACRLLKDNKAVQAAVAAQEAIVAARMGVSRQQAIQGLLEAVALAREQRDPAAMISGFREIGRMCGYYAPERVSVVAETAYDRLLRQMEALSDEELAGLVAGQSVDGDSVERR